MERHQKEYEFFTILSKHKIWKYLTLLISKRRVLKRLKRTCFNLNRIHNTRLEKRSCTLLVRDLRASFTHEKPALIQKESFQHSLRYQYTPFVIIHAWIFLAFSFPSVSFFSLPFFKRVYWYIDRESLSEAREGQVQRDKWSIYRPLNINKRSLNLLTRQCIINDFSCNRIQSSFQFLSFRTIDPSYGETNKHIGALCIIVPFEKRSFF